jgi:GT2 family glycosyltransferase
MYDAMLSIVIAAWQEAATLKDFLTVLASQVDEDTEVIVVCEAKPPASLVAAFSWVRWIGAAPGSLTPELWSLGMAQSRGDVVAITTTHFAPEPDWASNIRRAHARLDVPAIGGAIVPPRGGRVVEWATYFIRYSQYLRYITEQAVPDLPGDNASYKRAVFATHPECLMFGFWEADLHRRLREEGKILMFVPEIRIIQRASFGFTGFLYQRLAHGRHFGQFRSRDWGLMARVVAILASPLIPLVFFGKIVFRVLRNGRDWVPFIYSLPVLICFILAWSMGEVWSYLLPARPKKHEAYQHG